MVGGRVTLGIVVPNDGKTNMMFQPADVGKTIEFVADGSKSKKEREPPLMDEIRYVQWGTNQWEEVNKKLQEESVREKKFEVEIDSSSGTPKLVLVPTGRPNEKWATVEMPRRAAAFRNPSF